MAFPSGVTTVACKIPVPTDFVGGGTLRIKAKIEIVARGTNSIVWSATGVELGRLVTETTQTGSTDLVFTVPAVDQNGWKDSAGNGYKNWAYRVTYSYSKSSTSADGKTSTAAMSREITKVFQPKIADAADGVNIGNLPSSNAAGQPIVSTSTVSAAQVSGLQAALDATRAQTKTELLNGASAAFDTFKEIQTALEGDDTAIATILSALETKADAGDISNMLDDLIDDYVPGTELAFIERTTTYTTTDTSTNVTIPGFNFSLVGKGKPVEIWFFAPNVWHSVVGKAVSIGLICNDNIFDERTQLAGFRSTENTNGVSGSVRRRVFLADGVTYNFKANVWAASAGTSSLSSATFAPIQFGAIAR